MGKTKSAGSAHHHSKTKEELDEMIDLIHQRSESSTNEDNVVMDKNGSTKASAAAVTAKNNKKNKKNVSIKTKSDSTEQKQQSIQRKSPAAASIAIASKLE